jgi:hypothetical protein
MALLNETIVISGTKQTVEAIKEAIDTQPGSQSQLTERKNLGGDAATWMVIGTFSVQALPHVLGFIIDYLALKQVKKIKIGDWEVENPNPEIIQQFLESKQIQESNSDNS